MNGIRTGQTEKTGFWKKFKRIYKRLNPPKKRKSGFRRNVEAIGSAVIIALMLKHSVVGAYWVPSGSMEPTLLIGDFLFTNQFLYGARIPLTPWRLPAVRDPNPGDIIVFQFPDDPGRDFIKRCVAVGGQELRIVNKRVYVDGEPFDEPPSVRWTNPQVIPGRYSPRDNLWVCVPEDHVFMMGDNRDNSNDSRFWGAVQRKYLRGRAEVRYWSWAYDPTAMFGRRMRWARIGTFTE
jgi:signal peptidase I